MAATACLWLVDDEGRRTADRLPFLDERGELDVEQALGDLVRILEALDAPQIFAEGETVVDADEVHSLAEYLVPWSELSDAMDLDELPHVDFDGVEESYERFRALVEHAARAGLGLGMRLLA